MNTSAYWHQKANPWVSAAVLCGGLVSACLLLFIYRVQSDAESFSSPVAEHLFANLAE